MVLPFLLTLGTHCPLSWMVASTKRVYLCLSGILSRNTCKKLLNHLNYDKNAKLSVPILAGAGIFFFITLKKKLFWNISNVKLGKKKSEMSKFGSFYLWVETENNLRWVLYKVSGSLQHKGSLGTGEHSVLVHEHMQMSPRMRKRSERRGDQEVPSWKLAQRKIRNIKIQCLLDLGVHIFSYS